MEVSASKISIDANRSPIEFGGKPVPPAITAPSRGNDSAVIALPRTAGAALVSISGKQVAR
jgi:hypothetical protein